MRHVGHLPRISTLASLMHRA